MRSNPILILLAAAFLSLGALSATAEDWSLKANWYESCSCDMACPCIMGSPATMGYCRGNGLVEIEQGNVGDVRLDNLNVLMAYDFGAWVKLYIDDKATPEQAEAAATVLKQETTLGAFFSGNAKLLSIDRTPVTVEKSDGAIKFSVPESTTELEVMKGPNGKPITIENLTIPWFITGYTQYKATTVTHKSKDHAFSFMGSNGATSHLDVSGEIESE